MQVYADNSATKQGILIDEAFEANDDDAVDCLGPRISEIYGLT
jgi:hypothetical protein